MKTRIIDSISVPSIRHDVDDTWKHFSHLLITAFGDILRQDGMITEDMSIYCTQRLRELDEKTLDSLVYNIPPAFVSNDVLFGDMRENEACTYLDKKIHWAASKDSPFLLLGYIGTGKSTFLDHYFYSHIKRKNPTVKAIIVNFKTAPDSTDDFIFYMLNKIDDQISNIEPTLKTLNRENLENLFTEEIVAIKSSIKDNEKQDNLIDNLFLTFVVCKVKKDNTNFQTLIKRKLNLLKDKSFSLWIILDNIDQHFYCLHHRAFVNAISIAHDFNCPLIISMRYVTLSTSDAREVYDSYRPRRLKLSLPNIHELIKKRLNYFDFLAKDILDEKLKWTGNLLRVHDLIKDINETSKLLSTHKILLDKTLLPLSNYNLRRLLEILLASYQSYYFFFDRFNNDRYRPTFGNIEKRFLYSHLLKNSDYYDPSPRDEQELFIVNLFENENKTAGYNHFIRIRLLQALISLGKSITMKKYVSFINNVFDYESYDILQAVRNFMNNQLFSIKGVISSKFDDSLIHNGLTEDHLASDDIEISITYSGMIHNNLMHKLEYLEIMKFSTYVDSDKYIEIQGEDNQKTFTKRAKSTKDFLSYLNKEEQFEINTFVKNQEKFRSYFGSVMPTVTASCLRQLDELESILRQESIIKSAQ